MTWCLDLAEAFGKKTSLGDFAKKMKMPGGAVGGLARKPSPNSVAPTSTSPSGEMESRNCARVRILIIKSTKKFSFSFEPFGEQEAQDQCWHKEERKRRQRRLAQATLKEQKTDLAKTSFNKKITSYITWN